MRGRVTISRMKKNINLDSSGTWPIRQIILGLVLFASGIAVGYTARDLPSITGNSGGAADGANAKDDPSWGPADAKVTIVEFGDFQCPHCRNWYSTVYVRLSANYGSKVRFIFRDFTLSFPESKPAAVAANCAGAQGKYWDYFSLLYGDPRGLGSTMYQAYAQEIGLNVSTFNSCIANNKNANEIDLDMKDAQRLGVNGVPAFFINNQMISGEQPYEVFQRAIDAELNK
jgi:protein-disulfide isomerase